MKLKDLKYYDPIINAEYIVANNLPREISFAWYVEKTLRKNIASLAKLIYGTVNRLTYFCGTNYYYLRGSGDQ